MSPHLETLRQRRQRVLQDIQAIDHLRRGCLSQQFFKPAPGQTDPRGPYFLLQGFLHGKKFNERIPAGQAPEVQALVDNYRRFQALAEEYVTLSDEITRLELQNSATKPNQLIRNAPRSSS